MDQASLLLAVKILAVIAAVELLVIVVGSIWSVGRDLWIRNQSQMLAEKLGDMTDAIEKVVVINDRMTEKLKSSDELNRDHRHELLRMLREQKQESQQLALDIERRTQDCIRQWQHTAAGTLSVNTFTGPGATVGQGQNVNQNQQHPRQG